MITINQAVKRVVKLEKDIKQKKFSITEDIVGLHEAVTKLGQAVYKKDKEEINRRVASALAGLLRYSDKLKIKDLEKEYLKRINEIYKAVKSAKGKGKK